MALLPVLTQSKWGGGGRAATDEGVLSVNPSTIACGDGPPPHLRFAKTGRTLLLAAFLSACTATPAQQAAHHPTIVSLNPCSDAILAEVAPENLLAISHYSQTPGSSSMDLTQARRFRATSGSVEELAALRPDVVVASSFLSPVTQDAIRRLGLRLELLPMANTVAQSRAQVAQLAALAGQPGKGAALSARIDAELKEAAPSRGHAPIPAVVWQSGGIVAGKGTLIDELLTRTGFANHAAGRGMRQADVLPLEVMLTDPPRVVLAAGDPRANEDRLLAHPALGKLKRTARVEFEPSLLFCGGPTIVRAADRLAEIRQGLPR